VSTPFAIRQTQARQPPEFLVFFVRHMNSAPQLRTLLALGRVALLPTVWSNCLAGWWLSGGANYWKLPFLFLGASLLYTGGAFLNDAFDADFDRQRRADRPIPLGKISSELVWRLGFGQLVAGIFLLIFCSQLAAGAGIFLALFILLYNFAHKFFTAAPWLLGACRFWIYLIAGATGSYGLNGWPIFCGAALAFYTAGSDYVLRPKTFRGLIPHWPLLLLAAPVILAMMMNSGHFRMTAVLISIILTSWIIRCVRNIFLGGEMNPVRTQANLMAGIVFVDWLASAPQISTGDGLVVFFTLFGLTKLAQKFVPAI
jgi:UbiA prenyltransferase family